MALNISFDTETWGTRAGCDARSLGACVFDPQKQFVPAADRHSGESKIGETFYVALDNPLRDTCSIDQLAEPWLVDTLCGVDRKYNLHREPKTVKWWHDQPAEAQAAFANPVDLKDGLLMFTAWLESLGVNRKEERSVYMWSHGKRYDGPVVEEWYHAVGLPVPFHYRAIRDTRTAFDIAAISDHSAWMKKFRQGIFHHALDDAQTQARAIEAAYRRLPY